MHTVAFQFVNYYSANCQLNLSSMVKCYGIWLGIYTDYLCGLTLAYMSVPIISFPAGKPAGPGLYYTDGIHYQTSPDELVDASLRLKQGTLNDDGVLVIKTGEFTGRSPKDRFIVYDEITAKTVDWNEFNQRIETVHYSLMHKKIMAYLNNIPE